MGQYVNGRKMAAFACRANEPDARLQVIVPGRFAARRIFGEFMRRWSRLLIWIAIGVFAAGCPKGKQHSVEGQKALDLQDYDAAVEYYLQALKAEPHNINYKIKLDQARFEAGQKHIRLGLKLRDQGDLQGAVSEFQRAQVLDPSNPAADQELKRTVDMIAERGRAAQAQDEQPIMENGEPALASRPPELKPLSRAPINLKMSNDAKVIFDTIGKLAGLTVIYDPDLQARRISTELNNVTLEQALDIVGLPVMRQWYAVRRRDKILLPPAQAMLDFLGAEGAGFLPGSSRRERKARR